MKKSEILNAIDKLKPALTDKGLSEHSGLIIFDENRIAAYGEEISVSIPLKSGFTGVFPWKEFTELIQKFETEEFDIKEKDEEILVISGKMKAGFKRIKTSYEPQYQNLNEDSDWDKLPDDFCKALDFCLFTVSSDQYGGVLKSVSIKESFARSSDNFRITEFEMDGEAPEILIPRESAIFLSKQNITDIFIDESVVHYTDGTGLVFTHRMISEEYPSLSEYFKVEGTKIRLPKELKSALDRASVLAEDSIDSDFLYVKISISKGKIIIRGEGEKGWVEETSRIRGYKGQSLTFSVVPNHLFHILDYSNEAVANDEVLLFKGDNFQHLVCLMKD